jgi:hypothetical protein
MMAWSRLHTLIAGVALIAATSAVALLGVAYNRSADPDALLKLSQRELRLPYVWGFEGENSGIALNLQWRVLMARTDNRRDLGVSYPSVGGTPEWLSREKLATLGFDVSAVEGGGEARYTKQLAKEVLLVLELDGPAYQRSLERTREFANREAALLATNPDKTEFKQRAKFAAEQLKREEQTNTRLFIVDAGLDAATLRETYPQRTRYALVRGEIRPSILRKRGQTQLTGYVSGLEIEQINVPYAFRPVFEPMLRDRRRNQSDAGFRYEVAVAFGKRLEPWITAASAKVGAE